MSDRADNRLDRLLAEWPTPALPSRDGPSGEPEWDEKADVIVARAQAAAQSSAAASGEVALFEPPALDPEPGEPGSARTRGGSSVTAVQLGESKMSESDDRPKPSVKRPSLKELAERVSKTPPPSSVSSTSTPLPGRPSSPALSTPIPSSMGPSSGPGSVRGSGVPGAPGSMRFSDAPAISVSPSSMSQPPVSVRDAQPPPSVSSSPGSVGGSGGPGPVSVGPSSGPGSAGPTSVPASAAPASAASNVVSIDAGKKSVDAKAAVPAKSESGGSSSWAGIGIALAGVAAAAGIFFFLRSDAYNPKPKSPSTTDVAEVSAGEEKKGEEEVAAADANKGEGEAPKPDEGGIDIANLGDTTADPAAPPPEQGGAAPPGSVARVEPTPLGDKPNKVENDGDLEGAMKDAVGADGKPVTAEPAAEDSRPKNLPDQPPQGSVTAAVGSVMGGARACVAGADDVSRANITFGSSGAVQAVSVSGWAAGKGAASCIQSALKGANVGPFSKPTFTFGVTIRP